MSQIALPLGWPADEADDAFIVSASNQAAVKYLQTPARWPIRRLKKVDLPTFGRPTIATIGFINSSQFSAISAQGTVDTLVFNASLLVNSMIDTVGFCMRAESRRLTATRALFAF